MKNKSIKPSVAIVLVNYNGFDLTKECIDSVKANDYSNYKIILVNNGSSDQSGSLLNSSFGDQIVYIDLAENKGVTVGNNAGIDYALTNEFNYVLFLNNDTIVSKDFLTRMIETSVDNSSSLVIPKIRLFYDKTRLDFWNGTGFNWWKTSIDGFRYYPYDGPEFNTAKEYKLTSTCCLLVPSVVFSTVGKMDERYFMYFDDADFTLRVTQKGYKIIYEPDSVILHKGGMSSVKDKSSFLQFYLTKRNIFYFYHQLCPSRPAKYFSFTKFFILNSLLCMKYLFMGNHKKLRVLLHAHIDYYSKRLGAPPKF